MSRLYIYLSMLLGIKILLLILFATLVFRGKLWLKKRRRQELVFPTEIFYCVKSSMKQMNDHFYVAHVVFTNKKNCTLTAHSESPRRASEGQD